MGTANPDAEVVAQGRKTLLNIICMKIKTALNTLISGSRCVYPNKPCDCAILGALVKVIVSQGLRDQISSTLEGVADSIICSVSTFSSNLSKLRLATAEVSSGLSHRKCGPWALEDERYGDEGKATILCRLVSEYAGHLEKQAERSGLNPDISATK